MKKLATLLTTIIFSASMMTAQAETPSIAFVKFSNDTRYQNVDAASILSDLVIEKLLASGKFNLVESNPIDQDMEKLLYDEKFRQAELTKTGIENKDLNEVFEGVAFDSKQAESIATAQVGQIISPDITAKIGHDNGAEYLIQGTIVGLGKGTWRDLNKELKSDLSSALAALVTKDKSLLSSSNVVVSALIVQSDLRIIKASTGEVIWAKDFIGYSGREIKGKTVTTFDAADYNSKEFMEVMNLAAENIAKGLIKDLDDGKIFDQ